MFNGWIKVYYISCLVSIAFMCYRAAYKLFSQNEKRLHFSKDVPANLTACGPMPSQLIGPVNISFAPVEFTEMEKAHPSLEFGGRSWPNHCQSQHKVAIIIPFRDREKHLKVLINHLHIILAKQELNYGIFVLEQTQNETFNRGKLMNVGYTEASKVYDWNCYIFHDVDILPLDDRALYRCSENPRHFSNAVDKFSYALPYADYFGGVFALTPEQIRKSNFFSNHYWGWGGEDDDLLARLKTKNYTVYRYPESLSKSTMLKHDHDKGNPINKCRFELLKWTNDVSHFDGLSTLTYDVVETRMSKLFSYLKVDIREKSSQRRALRLCNLRRK